MDGGSSRCPGEDTNMKMIIILVAFVALLAGGGYFAWTTYSAGNGDVDAEVDSGGSEEHIAEAGGDGALFVELDPITAPFIRDGRFAQYIVLTVSLEVSDDEAKLAVRRNMPRLRDAFVSELHALAAMRSPKQKLINLSRIKTRMLAGADRVLGKDVVLDVLVQVAS